MKKIVIIAGDRSGDLYGGFLSKRIKEKFPSVEIFSWGGDNLAAHSRQRANLLSHSVSGLIEVIGSLKDIFPIFKKAKEEIKKIKPDLIILIDFPDFNLRLAKALSGKYPIFYYVSPQVWAWRKKRVELIRRYIEKMVVIFKFEQDFYKQKNIKVLYFGHPLLEIITEKEIKPKKIISFLPGSRANEIKKHLPLMIKAKDILKKEISDYSFRIVYPINLAKAIYEKFSPGMEIVLHSYRVLQDSKFIIASSGTATVEMAILTIPYLAIYKVNLFSWIILKKLVATEFIAMVNILAGERIVDEFLQNEATPQNISQKALFYLKDPGKYEALKEKLLGLKEKLAPYQASSSFADFIGKYLGLCS